MGLVADYTIASGTNPRAARERAVALLREHPALVEDLLLRHVLEGQFPQQLPATVRTVEGEALEVVTASDGRQTISSQVCVLQGDEARSQARPAHIRAFGGGDGGGLAHLGFGWLCAGGVYPSSSFSASIVSLSQPPLVALSISEMTHPNRT